VTTAQPDRTRGVRLGAAAGDALGASYEFGRPRGPELDVAMVGGGGLGWEAGKWTDGRTIEKDTPLRRID
jgi:ADP-ribosyl-[dinitrogen reductase] hydrolase